MSTQGALLHSSLLECGWPRWCADLYVDIWDVELGYWLSRAVHLR